MTLQSSVLNAYKMYFSYAPWFNHFAHLIFIHNAFRWMGRVSWLASLLSLSGRKKEGAESEPRDQVGGWGLTSHAVWSPLLEKCSVHGKAQHGEHCGTDACSQPEGWVLQVCLSHVPLKMKQGTDTDSRWRGSERKEGAVYIKKLLCRIFYICKTAVGWSCQMTKQSHVSSLEETSWIRTKNNKCYSLKQEHVLSLDIWFGFGKQDWTTQQLGEKEGEAMRSSCSSLHWEAKKITDY